VRGPDDAETFNRLAGSMAIHCLHSGLGLVHVPDVVGRGHDLVPMDGCIIAHPSENDPAIDFLEAVGIPFVLIDPDPGRAHMPWTVSIDYGSGADQMFDLVSGEGRRRTILVRGRENNAWNMVSATAYSHWCERTGWAGRIYEVDEQLRGPDLEVELSAILSDEESDLGIAYMASDITDTMLAAIRHRGWAIPHDASVAALTDTVHSRMSDPPVTAMDLVHEQVATAAVDLLIERINGAEPPTEPIVIPPKISSRASTSEI
jgi:DNA-binding LacI/PurR family transcriptional regulator